MIPNPELYNQNESQIANDLLPPSKRKAKMKTWLTSLLSPVQWDHDLIFEAYAKGSNAIDWVAATSYSYGTRVRYINNAVYELINPDGLTSSTPPSQDPDNWIKVLDIFIGIRERARYNGQKIMLEWALNRFFRAPGTSLPFTGANHVDQIWIENTENFQGFFFMADDGTGADMANQNIFQQYFLSDDPDFNPNTFTIWVPIALMGEIEDMQPNGPGSSLDRAKAAIKAFADKYVQANHIYIIDIY